MENTIATSNNLAAEAYEKYYLVILRFIILRIPYKYDAEDLTQDVFVNLLGYNKLLRPESLKCFVFTIARNVLTDYLRRYIRKQEATTYMYEHTVTYVNDTEEKVIVKELQRFEKVKLQSFPLQRRKIYYLSRFEEQNVREISQKLQISMRTVEGQLLKGRKVMRAYIRECI